MTDASGVAPASDEMVAELEALYAAATPGEWGFSHDSYGDEWWFGGTNAGEVTIDIPGGATMVYGGHDQSNAQFVAALHNAFPALLARLREAEGRSQLVEAEHATLMSMVEKAASTLRDLADLDDEGSPRLMVIAAEAKRTLKAMREIGGIE